MTTHIHPDWCGHGHVCSIDGPGGEHRSHPVTVDGPTYRLVITRTRHRSGTDHVEVRIVADLPDQPRHARRVLGRIVTGIASTVTAAQLPGGGR